MVDIYGKCRWIYQSHGSYGHICKDSVQKLDSSVKELGTTLETEAFFDEGFELGIIYNPLKFNIDTQT